MRKALDRQRQSQTNTSVQPPPPRARPPRSSHRPQRLIQPPLPLQLGPQPGRPSAPLPLLGCLRATRDRRWRRDSLLMPPRSRSPHGPVPPRVFLPSRSRSLPTPTPQAAPVSLPSRSRSPCRCPSLAPLRVPLSMPLPLPSGSRSPSRSPSPSCRPLPWQRAAPPGSRARFHFRGIATADWPRWRADPDT